MNRTLAHGGPLVTEKIRLLVAHGFEFDFYRFAVTNENSAAVIRIRRRRMSVRLQEASIDGFTVLVQPAEARRLQLGDAPRTSTRIQNAITGHYQGFRGLGAFKMRVAAIVPIAAEMG